MMFDFDAETHARLEQAFGIRRGPNRCPTCRAIGDEQCVRGRFPSAIWKQQIPFPEGHDSRRSANPVEVSA